jgi:MFS family permease
MAGRPDGEVGLVVGAAALFNIAAALLSGGLVDRFGGRTIYLAGIVGYLAASLPIAVGLVTPDSPLPVLLAVRLLQGCGLGFVLPAVMTILPGLVSRQALPTAIGVAGVAGNVSLAITPAIALAIFEAYGFAAVGVAVCAVLGVGVALIWPVRGPGRVPGSTSRIFRPAWRPEWAAPLAVSMLVIVNWGVITGYLPQRAELAGADVGLFFTADALALVALRIPAGWLAGRVGSLPLLLLGLVVTAVSVTLLLLPSSTPLLIAAGAINGAGSAFVFPVLNLELSLRSDHADRGSAFGLFSVAFGIGVALGSIGLAPFFHLIGFEGAMTIGIACTLASIVVALSDRLLRMPPVASREIQVASIVVDPTDAEMEPPVEAETAPR